MSCIFLPIPLAFPDRTSFGPLSGKREARQYQRVLETAVVTAVVAVEPKIPVTFDTKRRMMRCRSNCHVLRVALRTHGGSHVLVLGMADWPRADGGVECRL
jgi:hypothetical protein